MFRPDFLERLIQEVEHFKDWAKERNFQIMKPSIMSDNGIVLADLGMDTMLKKLVEGFILPICKVFFNDVCLEKFDSLHGYVVEYGMDPDFDESAFHVDDSEVTVNVCLGEKFEGGETYFRGVRCVKHANTDTQRDEMFNCPHKAGQVMLHRGRHRNGCFATTFGYRANMIIWCRSSVYREQQTYEKGFFNWCGQCVKEHIDNQSQILDAKIKVKKRKTMIKHKFVYDLIRIETSKPDR